MQLKNIHKDKDFLVIVYKLSYDLLLLLLVTFTGVMVVEGLLPGFLAGKVSLTKIGLAIFLMLGIIAYLGKNLKITYKKLRLSKTKLLPVIILFSFLLIGNSLLKFAIFENFIITLVTLFIIFLFYEIIFKSQD